jgi:hypothetical protein
MYVSSPVTEPESRAVPGGDFHHFEGLDKEQRGCAGSYRGTTMPYTHYRAGCPATANVFYSEGF